MRLIDKPVSPEKKLTVIWKRTMEKRRSILGRKVSPNCSLHMSMKVDLLLEQKGSQLRGKLCKTAMFKKELAEIWIEHH